MPADLYKESLQKYASGKKVDISKVAKDTFLHQLLLIAANFLVICNGRIR